MLARRFPPGEHKPQKAEEPEPTEPSPKAEEEAQRLFLWRKDRLMDAGFPLDAAEALAGDKDLRSWHDAKSVLKKCDGDVYLALTILL